MSEGRLPEDAYPYRYASRDPAFMSLPGAVLWLVTLPRYARVRQAPSLVARLEIEDVARIEDDPHRFEDLDTEVRESGNLVAIARRQRGAYLPLNNAFHMLLQLDFESRAPNLRDSHEHRDRSRDARLGPYFTIAGHFRRHRWLTAESIPTLERYADAVRRGRRVFLSYKRSDFPDAIDRDRGPRVSPTS